MKDSRNTAKKLLDLPYAPEAEQYLDELERSGQFRVGIEAEVEDAEAGDPRPATTMGWGRGSGSVSIQDWWTTGRVALRIGPASLPATSTLARVNDSLVLRTQDGLDRAGARGLSRPDSRRLDAAHHLQRRQRMVGRRTAGAHRQLAHPGRFGKPLRTSPRLTKRASQYGSKST